MRIIVSSQARNGGLDRTMVLTLAHNPYHCPLRTLASLIVWFFLFGGGSRSQAQNSDDGTVLFENRIRPLLIKECFDCHSANAKKLKGGLRLDTRDDVLKGGDSGPVIIPGDAEGSLLIKAVRHIDKDLAMPRGPQGSKKLPESDIADLVHWVKLGAPYPDTKSSSAAVAKSHWSFQPIQDPPAPVVK